jgi:secreted Zn-dependent insulinase-like peptidase
MATRKQKNLNARNTFLNKYFNLIIAVIVIFILFFGYLFVIMPKYNNTKLLIKSNISEQKKLYAQQKRKLDSLRILNELFNKVPVEDINKFNSVLPSKYQAETLFGEFEEIISDGGWTLNSISWTDLASEEENLGEEEANSLVNKEGNIGIIELNLQIQNLDYAGVKRLLKVLESNLRLFDIVSLSFSGESSANLTLYTYYYEK